MKDWLTQKDNEQKSLFDNFLKISMQTLNKFNEDENQNVSIRVVFSKDKWIEGNVVVEFIQRTKSEDIDAEENEYEYQVINKYEHSVYSSGTDIYPKKLLSKLMMTGLLTNNWFAVLDTSRKYDTTFVLSGDEYVLENDDCEYKENRMAQSHSGFNITQSQSKMKKK